jgi:hypothetical protein
MKATRAWLARSVPLSMSMALAAALLTLMSCTPGSEISVQESDVVATIYDPNVDFSGIDTYQMPDTINHILEEGVTDDKVSRKYDQEILDLIAANLNARGFQRIDEGSPDTPDVVVFVSATAITNWYAYSYYPGGYWGYGGWGWYYPYYPAWGVSYAYTTGTLIVDMVNVNEPDSENKTFPNYWRGVCNGVLDDVESSKVRRFTDSINQLFIQSPYLQSAGQ